MSRLGLDHPLVKAALLLWFALVNILYYAQFAETFRTLLARLLRLLG